MLPQDSVETSPSPTQTLVRLEHNFLIHLYWQFLLWYHLYLGNCSSNGSWHLLPLRQTQHMNSFSPAQHPTNPGFCPCRCHFPPTPPGEPILQAGSICPLISKWSCVIAPFVYPQSLRYLYHSRPGHIHGMSSVFHFHLRTFASTSKPVHINPLLPVYNLFAPALTLLLYTQSQTNVPMYGGSTPSQLFQIWKAYHFCFPVLFSNFCICLSQKTISYFRAIFPVLEAIQLLNHRKQRHWCSSSCFPITISQAIYLFWFFTLFM